MRNIVQEWQKEIVLSTVVKTWKEREIRSQRKQTMTPYQTTTILYEGTHSKVDAKSAVGTRVTIDANQIIYSYIQKWHTATTNSPNGDDESS